MNIPLSYMSLPYETSGSRSKNRFRIELLWGVGKMLDLMEKPDDFNMVFDYVCDIEVHLENGFEFYQIKSKSNGKTYTTKTLTKRKPEGSIIGKLYVLATKLPHENVLTAIVTNASFNAFSSDTLIHSFDSLSDKEKKTIVSAIKDELHIQDVDLSNLFYIQTYMDLEHPEDTINGRLTREFEKLKKCEPTNPNALYRLIVDTVSSKACYEYSSDNYNEVLRLKGISRHQFDEMLEMHAVDSKTGYQKARDYINALRSIKEKRKCNLALPNAVRLLLVSRPIKCIEKKIVSYILKSDVEDTEQALDLLISEFNDEFPAEISQTERLMIYLIILGRIEEGAYNYENDF